KKKRCSKCKNFKSLNHFNKNKNEKDGFHCHCKECKKEYRIKNSFMLKEWRTFHKYDTREYNKNWAKKNLGKKKKSRKEWYSKNKDRVLIENKIWVKKNPEKVKLYSKRYSKKNAKKIRESRKRYEEKNKDKLNFSRRERFKNNLQVRLKSNVSCSIRQKLKRNSISKKGRSTFTFLPYTVNELKQHLEKQFEFWMNWENWGVGKGRWNIDHKRPDCSFNYKSVDDEEFQKCWALDNLRPMDAIENIKKGNKIIG
ncbi:MAG: hypothetical protein KAJ30_05625, partial [Candidatus Heimdallarchaeota archaeon]|nr:hypothetical protein [Candidatus Heimdallarchaeota archaeon]